MSKIYLMLLVWLLSASASMAKNTVYASPNLIKTQIAAESSSIKDGADITGKIVTVNRASSGSNNKDFLGSIYVEGGGNYDRASISIKTQTRIFVLKNGRRRAAAFDDLQINLRIQVAFSGPVLESYPVQATAGEIIILAADKGTEKPGEPNDRTLYPLTKTDYLRLEGEQRGVTLRLFDEVDLPFAAYYPENDLTTETGASDEGQSLRFVSKMGGTKNENAYIHIFFPHRNPSPAQVRRLVSGDRGLFRSNGWRVRNVKPNTNYNFTWAKEQIFFAGRNNEGFVLIGGQRNRAFYVIVHYPKEYAEEFTPRAELVLRNLLVKPDESTKGENENAASLPPSIRAALDKNYRDWGIALLDKAVVDFYRSRSKDAPRQIAQGDFNGDGRADYALNLIHRVRSGLNQDFIIFLGNGRGFIKRVLESSRYFDTKFETGVFLSLKNKGQTSFDYQANKNFRLKTDAVEVVYFEKASAIYVYERNKFRRILTGD